MVRYASGCTTQHAGQAREDSLCLYHSTCWSDQRRLTVYVCTTQHAGQTREDSLCMSVPLSMLVRPEKTHCGCLYHSTCWSDQRRLTVYVCTTQHAGQTREDSLCLYHSTCWSDQRRLTVYVCTTQHAGQTGEDSLCMSVPLNMLVRPEKTHCVCFRLYHSTCWSDWRR